jgi:hypothetical protein
MLGHCHAIEVHCIELLHAWTESLIWAHCQYSSVKVRQYPLKSFLFAWTESLICAFCQDWFRSRFWNRYVKFDICIPKVVDSTNIMSIKC